MRFEQLIKKVEQAENAIEANERKAGADLRQLKASWKAAWTPGRIVLAGFGSGLLMGFAEPGRNLASGSNAMRFMSMAASLTGLFAGTSAQAAAEEAGAVAESAASATDGAVPGFHGGADLRHAEHMASERIARAADAARAVGAES